jgi:hypothetical protein
VPKTFSALHCQSTHTATNPFCSSSLPQGAEEQGGVCALVWLVGERRQGICSGILGGPPQQQAYEGADQQCLQCKSVAAYLLAVSCCRAMLTKVCIGLASSALPTIAHWISALQLLAATSCLLLHSRTYVGHSTM